MPAKDRRVENPAIAAPTPNLSASLGTRVIRFIAPVGYLHCTTREALPIVARGEDAIRPIPTAP